MNTLVIKSFLERKISKEEFDEHLTEVFNGAKGVINSKKESDMSDGKKAKSYFESASEARKLIDWLSEMDSALPLDAILCDMFNNLAHFYENAEISRGEERKKCSDMFSYKIGLIYKMVEDCEKEKNTCYGKIYDEKKGRDAFVIDIPGFGQLAWHLAKGKNLGIKTYEHEKDSLDYTNLELLKAEIKESSLKFLPSHTRKVIKSFDVNDMERKINGDGTIGQEKNKRTENDDFVL